MAGRKPGGPKTGGRKPGSPNKANRSLREAARSFTDDALKVLAEIMVNGTGEAARIAAASAILDRGHGRPTQAVEVDANVKATVTELRRTIVDPKHPNS